MGKDCLPEHLKHAVHWDYWGPFSKIPRAWTAFCWGKPVLVLGNQKNFQDGHPKPIPGSGQWAFVRFPDAPWYWKWAAWGVAVTLKSGRHFRVGARWDDVDSYVQFPTFATRLYPQNGERDTSTTG